MFISIRIPGFQNVNNIYSYYHLLHGTMIIIPYEKGVKRSSVNCINIIIYTRVKYLHKKMLRAFDRQPFRYFSIIHICLCN